MTREPAVISGLRVAHQDASVDLIDAAAARTQPNAVEALLQRQGVAEAFALQTCNRAERYVVTNDPETGAAVLEETISERPAAVSVEMGHEESLRHLMRVAAGLESLVPGEDQVLGQVRDAYEDAKAVDGLGPVLEPAVTKAIHVGERVRTETSINEGVVSLGSAAVELADQTAELADATALVVGAGEIATLAAKALSDRTGIDHLVVANRTVSHAEHVAGAVDVPASATGLDDLATTIPEADVVVTGTASPQPFIEETEFDGAGETVVIDIGQPRDVREAVEWRSNVTLYDLDDLEAVTETTRANRKAAAKRVEAIVDSEFEQLLTQYKRTRADDVISSMYESAERVKERELRQALESLEVDEDERAVLEAMADSLVNQLLAAPTKALRDAAENDNWTTIDTALRLFDPNFGDDPEPEAVTDVPTGVRERLSALADDD